MYSNYGIQRILCLLIFLIPVIWGCKKYTSAENPILPQILPVVDTLVKDGVPEDKQYNVILILYDDIGYEIPTYTGGQSYKTPSLDKIANGGTQFSQCHVSPLCSPTRFMLFTGQYNFRNYKSWGVMSTDEYSIGNLMKDAGYKTCVAGKWQMDGGANSINKLGFDNFLVNNVFTDTGETDYSWGSLYKNPLIYGESGYLSNKETAGKYSQNLFRDFIFNFIDNNKTDPFFIYWPFNLGHMPFCPPPNHPDFDKWNNRDEKPGDTIYFPSMVEYMDMLTGQLVDKLSQDNLLEKTIFLIMADNGTPFEITSKWNGQDIVGGKTSINEAGTHVPMLAYCPGTIKAGRIDTGLISAVDIMPTLASLVHKDIPAKAGTMDGVSFAARLFNNPVNYRNWIYCSYNSHPDIKNSNWTNWMQNLTFKRIERDQWTTFSNISVTPFEDFNLRQRSPDENYINNSFGLTMDSIISH